MRHPTLHDIARRCEVSTATVSAVVNGAAWVSDTTRARVQGAVTDMGYHPNQYARGLKRRQGRSIGVIVSDLTNPFFTQVVRSLSHALHLAGRPLTLCDSDHQHALGEANLRMLVEGQIAGLVVIGDSVPEETLGEFVRQRAGVPVIAIERDYALDGVSCLLVDSEQGAFSATRHLMDQGYERIAMITGPGTGAGSSTYGRAQRFDGYHRALGRDGVEADSSLVVEGNFRYEGGVAAMRTLLLLHPRPDAVFAANDMMALGAMAAIREAGLTVGRDIALVGFDNVPMSALIEPPLTTMAMPMSELGDAAAQLLEVQLGRGGRHDAVRQTFSADLVIRHSSLRPIGSIA